MRRAAGRPVPPTHLPQAHFPYARRQRGIALVLALWLTVMLTVIGTGFAFSMRSEALAARNMISLAQARAAANGAIERTVFEVSRISTPDTWKRDGAVHKWQDGDIALAASATDEAAKIDLNAANEVLLRSLFVNLGGTDPDLAQQLDDPGLVGRHQPASPGGSVAAQEQRAPENLRSASHRSRG